MSRTTNVRKKEIISFSIVIIALSALTILVGCNQERSSNDFSNGQTIFRGNFERTGVYDGGQVEAPNSFKWKTKLENDPFSSPQVAQGNVYYGTSANPISHLIALGSQAGQEIWSFKTGDAIYSAPLIDNGTVFFGSLDGYEYALDANSGGKKWSFNTELTPRPLNEKIFVHGVESSPAMGDGIVYFGCYGGVFYALDRMDGKEIWSFRTSDSEPITASPALSDGLVLFTCLTKIYALDAKTGSEKWEFQTQSKTMNQTPAVSNGLVFIDDKQEVLALDINTGNRIWSDAVGKQAALDSMVAIQDGIICFGDAEGFYAVDAQTGKKKWENKTGINNGAATSPSIAGDEVYFADLQGNVDALDLYNGQMHWKFKYQNDLNKIPTSLTITDGVIYLGSTEGTYAIGGGSSA